MSIYQFCPKLDRAYTTNDTPSRLEDLAKSIDFIDLKWMLQGRLLEQWVCQLKHRWSGGQVWAGEWSSGAPRWSMTCEMSHVEWLPCRSCSFLSHQLPQYVIGCPLPKHVVQIGRSFYSILSYRHFDSVVQQQDLQVALHVGGGRLIPRLALREKK